MSYPTNRVILCFCVTTTVMIGCGKSPEGGPASSVPAIPVSQPVEREVTDFADFTGRIDAVETVQVRARVTGYLVKIPFREGAEVKQGDLLFGKEKGIAPSKLGKGG